MQIMQHAVTRRDILPITLQGHAFEIEDLAASDLRRIVEGELNADCYKFKEIPIAPARILDIGGNIGMTAMLMSRLWPRAIISSFEPHPENAKSFRVNVERNDCHNVFLQQCAVTAKGGAFRMTMGEDNTGGATGCLAAMPANSVEVNSIKLDDVVKRQMVDLLKIDIEGAEHAVLAGFNSWHLVQRLVIELHQNDHLARQGYTIEKTWKLIEEKMGKKAIVVTTCNPMGQ